MRSEMREALERFWRWMSDGTVDGAAAAELFCRIRDLGGLEAALADDPTDNAPGLAAVVAAQGVALEALGQQVRGLETETRSRLLALEARAHLLEGDLKRAEDAVMDLAHERSAPVEEGWLVEPVELTWWALNPPLTRHAHGARWSSEDVEIWNDKSTVRARKGQRVGVRPDGRVEVVS